MLTQKQFVITVLLVLIPALGAGSGPLPAGITNQPYLLIQGETVQTAQTNLLLHELKQSNFTSTPARRFEIIFFSSLPVTLFISFSILELMIRNGNDKNNPDKKFQKPHYIYMFSSSIATSLLLALDDYRDRNGINYTPPEFRFKLPFFQFRF